MMPATEAVTRVVRRRRVPRALDLDVASAWVTRQTLHLGCVECGSAGHDSSRCALRIEDDKEGAT